MKKKGLLSLIFIIIFAVFGFFLGFISAEHDLFIDFRLIDLIVFYLFLIVTLFCVINLHEFGHYLFGKLLGYRLIMYRIGILSFTFENDKIKFEWIKNKGYDGLCAMIPPKDADFHEKKHILYYAGGVLFNFLSGLLILFALPFVLSFYGRCFIYIFSIFSILLGFINLIPFKTAGNYTDGKIILELLKKDQNVSKIITTMNRYTQLAGGIRPKDLSLDPNFLIDTTDPLLLLLHYYQALDQENDQQASLIIDQIINQLENFSTIALPGIYNELITAGVRFNLPEWVDKYYTLNEKSLTKDNDLNGERVKAYYAWYVGNIDQAREHIKKAKEVANKFPVRGQIKMELMLVTNLENKLASNKIEAQ